MRKKIFVFAVLAGKKSNANLHVLGERLATNFRDNQIPIDFCSEEQLISGRIENVGFYISFINDKEQLKQWMEMAKLFNLMYQNESVTRKELLRRYDVLNKSSSPLYQQIHYTAGLLIIEELEKFKDVAIYSFL